MCGIVGYAGNKKASSIILSSLTKLEYRGYDSAGIATVFNGEFKVAKAVGELFNLAKKMQDGNHLNGTVGIGHNRWATHGKPSLANAHPHVGKRFAIVHNGIIENESFLKTEFLREEKFESDTDTEIVLRLFEKFAEIKDNTEDALKQLMSVLKGSYALAVIDKENPDAIYAVKNKSPLIIGCGSGFNMVGSDIVAMIEYTNNFLELQDMEYALVTKSSVNIFEQSGKSVFRKSFNAHINTDDVQKGTYPHYMLKEIEEQPTVLRRIVKEYINDDGSFKINNNITEAVKNSDKIYFVACGTSYHASLVGKFYFEKISHKACDAYIASEFVCNMPVLSENPFFIFVSQSGETADSIAALAKIKQKGYKCLAITNVPASTLSRESDFTLPLFAGAEIAVASTKAYSAQVSVMAILAAAVNNCKNINLYYELGVVASAMESLCLEKEKYKRLAHEFLYNASNCFYIGKGLDYYVSLEAALKLKEISYIYTEGFAAGELKHGPIALVEQSTAVIAVITCKKTNLSTRGNIKEVMARGAKVICISLKEFAEITDEVVISNVHEYLTPLAAVIPAHYIAYYSALERGCDIDKPRNLAKSVTVE